MDTDPRPPVRRIGAAPAPGLAAAALAGFVLAVTANGHTSGVGAAACIVVVAGAAVALARLVRSSSPALTLACSGVALVAAWLLPQRDDLASAVILTALFAMAVTTIVGGLRISRAAFVIALAGSVTLVIIRLAVSQVAVLLAAALMVVLAAGLAAGTRQRGWRPLVFATTLVVVTLMLTGYVGAETPAASWFGGGITHGPTATREVALTFDDGPNIDATPKIMAILDRYGVKGTFFEVGKAIDAEPAITRKLYTDGQLLGNHSYHHDDWRWLDPRYPELQRTQDAFSRSIGACPTMYRPPHGERTPFLARVVHDHHMHIVIWNVSAGDWATTDPQLVARRILEGTKPGAILLLHDGLDGKPTANRAVLVQALPLILDGLRAAHLTPVRLDELLHTRAYTPC